MPFVCFSRFSCLISWKTKPEGRWFLSIHLLIGLIHRAIRGTILFIVFHFFNISRSISSQTPFSILPKQLDGVTGHLLIAVPVRSTCVIRRTLVSFLFFIFRLVVFLHIVYTRITFSIGEKSPNLDRVAWTESRRLFWFLVFLVRSRKPKKIRNKREAEWRKKKKRKNPLKGRWYAMVQSAAIGTNVGKTNRRTQERTKAETTVVCTKPCRVR